MIEATSVRQALAFLRETPVDLVISDFNLRSRENGMWLLQRAHELQPRARRMLMSGELQLDESELDVERYWRKPLDTHALLAHLAE